MIGKQFYISGMTLEIVADNGEQWQTRNLTTGETVYMNKDVLAKAIRLGMAEEITKPDEES